MTTPVRSTSSRTGAAAAVSTRGVYLKRWKKFLSIHDIKREKWILLADLVLTVRLWISKLHVSKKLSTGLETRRLSMGPGGGGPRISRPDYCYCLWRWMIWQIEVCWVLAGCSRSNCFLRVLRLLAYRRLSLHRRHWSKASSHDKWHTYKKQTHGTPTGKKYF